MNSEVKGRKKLFINKMEIPNTWPKLLRNHFLGMAVNTKISKMQWPAQSSDLNPMGFAEEMLFTA